MSASLLVSLASASSGAGAAGIEMERRPASSSLARARAALREKAARDGSVQVIAELAEAPHVGISAARRKLTRDLGHRASLLRSFRTLPLVALAVDSEGLEALEASPEVAAIVEDLPHATSLYRSVPRIQALAAWAIGNDGDGQVVAVIDTGVDATHPFLAGRVIHEACFSQSRDCPNGSSTQTGPGAAIPCWFSPRGCRHGTHVAGIAAGRGDAFSGVAPGADVIAIQVFSRSYQCAPGEEVPCPRTFTSDYLRGLEHVLAIRDRFPIAAVNLSFGRGGFASAETCDRADPFVKRAMDALRAAGIATVVAAGNDGLHDGIATPACISSAIAVAAAARTSGFTAFSNVSSQVALVAPGDRITSSAPGGSFVAFSGTSMAAPHVTGAWAILRGAAPGASVDDVLRALAATGSPVSGPGQTPTKPLLNVRGAVDRLRAEQNHRANPCGCPSDVDNVCLYSAPRACGFLYCDPNGDRNRGDADWMRGWNEYRTRCGA